MTESETSSAVFRNTSLTMRQRFTPASACSTRIRIRPNFRLARFSAAVSSPPGGFFFAWHVWATAGSYPWQALSLYNTVPGG